MVQGCSAPMDTVYLLTGKQNKNLFLGSKEREPFPGRVSNNKQSEQEKRFFLLLSSDRAHVVP